MAMGFDGDVIAAIYFSMLFVPAVLGILIGASGRSGKIPTVLCSISCIVGALCYPVWYVLPELSATFPVSSALGEYGVYVDGLSAVFISISSIVFLMVVVHMSHSGHGYTSRYNALVCALFVSCVLCMCAETAVLLIMSWELVSMITFLMADTDGNDGARWRFFAITHVGGLILMAVIGYMWYVSGTEHLLEWDDLGALMGPTASAMTVFMLFMGFGTKLGTVPFHAWMPDMYSGSPTHTTALLTTVCSNVAVLMLFKGVFSYVGVSSDMMGCAAVLCILAAVTALWGAMESMIQVEPKRILAYSSMENMALVTMCLSLAMIFSDGHGSLEALVIMAALLHTLNHSVFKSLMMLAVDSIEDSTGERRIDRLGGLACILPGLSVVALIGVASLAAIPPMNGFVSEWLMLQSLIGTDAISSDMRVAMPLLMAMMGVCGMIVATSYARLYGFIFLGRPRSEGASSPRPLRKGSLMPLAVLASMCVAMGMLAFPIMDAISSGVSDLTGLESSYRDGMSGSLMPLTLGLMLVGCAAMLVAANRLFKKKEEKTDTWGCGGVLDERMQYSSEGFSQPIVRVFHPIYGDTSSVEDNRYSTRFVEPFVKYIYRPVGGLVTFISRQVTRLQTGNIQSYLGYILITLVVALLAVRLL